MSNYQASKRARTIKKNTQTMFLGQDIRRGETDFGAYRRRRSCSTKKTFWTKKSVEKAVAYRRSEDGLPWSSYLCPYCGRYHLTSNQKKKSGADDDWFC